MFILNKQLKFMENNEYTPEKKYLWNKKTFSSIIN